MKSKGKYCTLILLASLLITQNYPCSSRDLTEGEKRSAFCPVSIIKLISQPERFDKKWVTVRGYLSTGFEDSYLYTSKEFGDRMFHEDGIQVEFDEKLLRIEPVGLKKEDAHHQYASIYGKFQAKEGCLTRATRLYVHLH